MQQQLPPWALVISSMAYFFNSIHDLVPPISSRNSVVPFRRNGLVGFSANLLMDRSTVLVDTNYGTLRGLKDVSRNGRRYYSFRGVPYAAEPLGELRFSPPEPPTAWFGIRDATRPGSECLQMNVITRRNIVGAESCLFLNIFTHKIQSSAKYVDLAPVIVFFHGGLFMSGGSNIYRPKYFMDEENIVLVTLNYRLASFGFLNTGDNVVSGNMGMKDQVQALKWVKDNIAFFGGDPSRVTIMGESAGGASVGLHLLSPLSAGLFHRAIAMSGTALSPWAFIDQPELQAEEFARDLKCPTDNTTEMVACLRSLDANTITKVHFGYIYNLANNKRSVYGPTVERVTNDAFLPQEPIHLLKAGKINKVPLLTGVNSEEGLVYLIPIIRNSTMNRLVNTEWDRMAGKFLGLHPTEINPQLLHDIKKFYLNDSDISLQTIKKAADMISDRAFFLDNHDAAIMHSQVADVYPYFYTYNGRYAMGKLLFVKSPLPFRLPDRYDFAVGTLSSWFAEYVLRIREPNYFGVGHSDEIPLFFNAPFIRREVVPEDEDYIFSRTLIRLWVSFAETGVPNTRDQHLPAWVPLRNATSGNYSIERYQLDVEPKMIQEPFFERLKFWKSRNISYTN